MATQETRAPWGFYTYGQSAGVYILDDFGNAVDVFSSKDAMDQWAYTMVEARSEIAFGYMIH